LERSTDDPTIRIGLFYPTAPSVHVSSRNINDLNPNVLDLEVHPRLAHTCEAAGSARPWLPCGNLCKAVRRERRRSGPLHRARRGRYPQPPHKATWR